MGEKNGQIGNQLEDFGEKLFSKIGWELVAQKLEINCTKRSHKTTKGNQKRTHGIDLMFSFLDSYTNRKIGTIIECKNYQWKSVKGNIQSWFNQLVETIECAQNASELNNYMNKYDTLNNGILLINVNDGEFDKKTFDQYVISLNSSLKRNPLNIYVASVDMINKWTALLKMVEKIKQCKDDFKYVYFSIGSSDYCEFEHINLTHLFSKFVFGTYTYKDQRGKTCEEMKGNVVFSFDECTEESMKFLYDMFKYYQLQAADEYMFCFYPNSSEDIDIINKFPELSGISDKKVIVEVMDNRFLNILPNI